MTLACVVCLAFIGIWLQRISPSYRKYALMLAFSLRFIIEILADLLTGVFLMRFLMQWMRIAFHNPLGQFIIAASDWAVRPVRKVLPGLWGIDLASLLLAWLTQFACLALTVGLMGAGLDPGALGILALLAVIECLRVMLYVIFAIVLMTAVLSWVNPYAPMAPLLNALARPFLTPLRRFIPPLGGVDLTPLVLLIVLQLLIVLLASLRVSILS